MDDYKIECYECKHSFIAKRDDFKKIVVAPEGDPYVMHFVTSDSLSKGADIRYFVPCPDCKTNNYIDEL